MSHHVDMDQARQLLPWLEPEIEAEERGLRGATPGLDDAAALDAALRAALARLRVDVSRGTFLYLRWKVETVRRAVAATHEAFDTARRARAQARLDRRAAAALRNTPRVIHDRAGECWVVSEVGPNDLLGCESPQWLTFRRAGAQRQVRTYPANWRACPDDVLIALLPPA